MEFFEAMGAGNNALAGLAQLVEHLICNQGVTSSNLVAGTIFSLTKTNKPAAGLSG